MIDILIGLCLVFAMFAGLVSSVNEVVAQLLEMRGKVLFEGVALLMGELEGSGRWRRWLGQVDRKIHEVLNDTADLAAVPGLPALTQKLFAHPLIDTLSQPGSKPSYIEPACFAEVFVQFLAKGERTPERIAASLAELSPHLQTLFGPMLETAGGDLVAFKTKVEQHFSLVMDRVGGWYKRRSQAVMFAVGFLLAAVLNVDTLHIAHYLRSNPAMVSALVETAQRADNAAGPLNPDGADSEAQVKLRQSIEALRRDLDHFRQLSLPIGWNVKYDSQGTPCAIQRLDDQKAPWLGWLITAMTGTLGAPFWFDAISKLFAIRGSGRKPPAADADK
ncbi:MULTISPECIES: hypothetical protein [Methylomonas]|uniref:Uncharacterized protein n=1 Tax=Methylomonas koyamae TaxID=702114 RepID=A0A177NQU6_9GAMM|nr:hypothetical protein [Methylomonas koyamae]OAI19569.1 hypothetical protein A1355_04265 [Methylomonas koyamae]